MEVLFVVVVFMSNREIQDRAYRLRRLFFDLLMAFFFEEWFFSFGENYTVKLLFAFK